MMNTSHEGGYSYDKSVIECDKKNHYKFNRGRDVDPFDKSMIEHRNKSFDKFDRGNNKWGWRSIC